MAKTQNDWPIFFDASGKRWRRLKLWGGTFLIVLLSLVAWEGYRIAEVDGGTVQADQSVNADALADKLGKSNLPVIGEGPLARVVEVKDGQVRAVYGNETPRRLSQDDRSTVGSYGYAIERYGATSGGKRLVLTFDDGPDPQYTPGLLDFLSQQSVPVTFFVTGQNASRHPDLIKRMVREGHGIANHSFSHADFETTLPVATAQEINLTARTIRAVSGHDTTFMRPPYVGIGDQSLRNSLHGILQSQRQGMATALYDFDTEDWRAAGRPERIKLPPLDGKDHVLLLHDAGGDRSATVTYVKKLVAEARAKGYSFVPMHALYPENTAYFKAVTPDAEDTVATTAVQASTDLPLQITLVLFVLTVAFVFVGLVVYVLLAIIETRKTRHLTQLDATDYEPAVSVIVPSYNEGKVLNACIRGLRKSDYQNLRIIIVDDGSTDDTWAIAKRLARRYDNVRAYRQSNAGKAAAVNLGIKRTWSPVIVCMDADTIFLPDTVSRLVRHFKDPRVGAVAGMVEPGNKKGLLAKCQALEYATSISLERTAQAWLGAIPVVPGACGAWRRQAVVAAGRYSSRTLAEDADLTIGVQAAGYRVIQDNTALALTEVPMDLRAFARQRFRWAFGNVQVFWKYRGYLLGRKRTWLNSFVLPLAIVSTIGPVLFLPLLGFLSVKNLLDGNWWVLVLFSAVNLAFLLIRAIIALRLGRHPMRYLLMVPIARALYGPLRIYLLYGTFLKAFQGEAVGWNKLARAGMALHTATAVSRTGKPARTSV